MKGFSGLLVALLVFAEVQSFIFEDDGGTRFCSRDGFYPHGRKNKQLEGSCSTIDRQFEIESSRRMDRETSRSSRERRFIEMNEFGRSRNLERIPDESLNEIRRNDRSLRSGSDTTRINGAGADENRLTNNREVRSSRSDIRNSRILSDILKSIRTDNEGERRETIASFRNSRKSIEPSEIRDGKINHNIRDEHIRSNRKTDNMRGRRIDTRRMNFQTRYNRKVPDYNNRISTNNDPVDSRFSPGSLGIMNKNRETRRETNEKESRKIFKLNRDMIKMNDAVIFSRRNLNPIRRSSYGDMIGNLASMQKKRSHFKSRSERFSLEGKSFPSSKLTEENRSSIPPSETNRDIGKKIDEVISSRRNSRTMVRSSADQFNSNSRIGRNERITPYRKDVLTLESNEKRSPSITPSVERNARISTQNRFITTGDDKTRNSYRSVSRIDKSSLFVRNDGRRSLERLREFGNDRRQRQNSEKREIDHMNRVHDTESRSFRENVRRQSNTISTRRVTETREPTMIYTENLSDTRKEKVRNIVVNSRISEPVRNLQRDISRMDETISSQKQNNEYNSYLRVTRNERISSHRNDVSNVRRSSSKSPLNERITKRSTRIRFINAEDVETRNSYRSVPTMKKSFLFVRNDGRRSLEILREFGNDRRQVQNSEEREINTPKEDENRIHRTESRSSRENHRRETNTISARREPTRREKESNIEINRRSSEAGRFIQRDTSRSNEVISSLRNSRSIARSSDDIPMDISARRQNNQYNSNSRIERNERISSHRNDDPSSKATGRRSYSISPLNERITQRSTRNRFINAEDGKTRNSFRSVSRMNKSTLLVRNDGRRNLESSREVGNDRRQLQNYEKSKINTPKEDGNRVHQTESRSSRGNDRSQTNTISARSVPEPREPRRIHTENLSDTRREEGRNIEVSRRSSEALRILHRDTSRMNEITYSRRNSRSMTRSSDDVMDISARKQKNLYNSNSRSYRRDVSTLVANERRSSSISPLNERVTQRSAGNRIINADDEKTRNLYKSVSKMNIEVNRRSSEGILHSKKDAERILQMDISRTNNLLITRARSSISIKSGVANDGNEFRKNSRELEISELRAMAVFPKTHRDISQRISDKGTTSSRGQMLSNLEERNERSIRATEDTSRHRESRGLYNPRMQKSSYETENKSTWSKRNVEMGAIHSSGKPDDYWNGIHLALASVLLAQLFSSRTKNLKTGCFLKNWIDKVQIF